MTWLVFCSLPAYADAGQRTADGLAAASAPEAPPKPVLNHPFIYLQDGRLFAAGGMATSYLEPNHELGEASEIWDSQTGQWKRLGDELIFRESQTVSMNQLADGRVLLFARDDVSDKPQYQARIWDPKTEKVEKLPLNIKAKRGSDVVVLVDGRVLIINGHEGAVDVWDSRSNRLVHNEVSEVENLRWKGVQLINGNVLLVEAYPSDGTTPRKGIRNSTCLLWNSMKDEWEQLAEFPSTLRDNSFLQTLEEGQAHAEVDGEAYQFSLRDNTWKETDLLAPPKAMEVVASVSNVVSAVAPAAAQAQLVSAGTPSGSETGLFGDIGDLLLRLQYAALGIVVPILLYGVVWLKQLRAKQEGNSLLVKLYPVALVALVLYVAWVVYWVYQEVF